MPVVGPVTRKPFYGVTGPVTGTDAAPDFGVRPFVAFEKETISMAANVSSVTQNLSTITNHAYCVPFATARTDSSSVSWQGPSNHNILCEMIDNGGTPAVRVSRGDTGTALALTIIVYVVQFDPLLVKVTQTVGTETTSMTEDHAVSPACVLAKTFAVGYVRPDTAAVANGGYNWSASIHFTSTTNLRFTRGTGGATTQYKYASYVVEDISGSIFDVQHASVATNWWSGGDDLTANIYATGNITISSVTVDRTFVMGSFRYDGGQNDPSICACQFTLTSATNIQYVFADKNTSFDTGEMRVQAVTFQAGVISKILQPFDASTDDWTGASSTITLASNVVVANSIVIPSFIGGYGQLVVENNANNSVPRMAGTVDVTSVSQITMTPSVGSPGYVTWGGCNVLEFL